MRTRTLLLLALAAGAAAVARAQAPADSVVRGYDDTRAQRLFGDFMSPFCPGLTLATCPSAGADSLRDDIRTRLALGQSPRAIREAYAATWGEEILGTPPWRGWGVVLWITPAVVLATGAALLARWLIRVQRRAGGSRTAEGPEPPVLDDRDRRRLDEELAALDDR
jgi:cytochrome c-type biogenesis protein CcmH